MSRFYALSGPTKDSNCLKHNGLVECCFRILGTGATSVKQARYKQLPTDYSQEHVGHVYSIRAYVMCNLSASRFIFSTDSFCSVWCHALSVCLFVCNEVWTLGVR